jgi:hypothetical protein
MSAPEALPAAKCELGPGQPLSRVSLASARSRLQAFSEDPRSAQTVIRVWNSGTGYNVLHLSRKGHTL